MLSLRPHRWLLLFALCALCSGIVDLRAADWPQWLGPRRDGTWTETGIIQQFPQDGLKPKWQAEIGGGYAGPAVVDDKVFVTDFLTEGDKSSAPTVRNLLPGTERILCFSASDGKLLWKREYPVVYDISYPAGPRCTPTVQGGKVYTLGAVGHLYCLKADDGAVVWSKELKKEYRCESPIWGFAGHPLIDGQKLFCLVGGAGSVTVAFDKDTGKELWKSLSAKEPGYSPPTLIEAGGKKQLIQWHGEALNSLDPQTGKLNWSVPLAPLYGMSIMAPIQAGDYLFASGIGNISALLKLAKDKPAAELVWRGDTQSSLYSICSPPFIFEGVLYGACQDGRFRAVTLETGKRLWESTTPTTGQRPANSGAAFLVKNQNRYFLFSESGDLIIADLSPQGYKELSRTKLLPPTGDAFGRKVVWSFPAYSGKCIFARNDKTLVCASLSAE